MKPAELAAVEAASKRERAHHAAHVKLGVPEPVCYCDTCIPDRETIAAAAPWLIAYVRESQGRWRHGSGDLGDLD